eukprot:gnl/TRDRNA2_/TRDRNA2_185933_c0_seq1.p1 gnl/TRDRNA2_/TRDRNA2_185933_c0~~gnl/TRDRNA2_/TRDRNA2_185933_c0_seq1.p1  ORF type:complete len:221 (+),score=27.51 gnl/TRDRNA2_/TRDRNA2_185933_c0_seq1:89-751(+)
MAPEVAHVGAAAPARDSRVRMKQKDAPDHFDSISPSCSSTPSESSVGSTELPSSGAASVCLDPPSMEMDRQISCVSSTASSSTLSDRHYREIRSVFQSFDGDGVGYIDVHELEAAMSILGYQPEGEVDGEIRRLMHANGGAIGFEAFIAVVAPRFLDCGSEEALRVMRSASWCLDEPERRLPSSGRSKGRGPKGTRALRSLMVEAVLRIGSSRRGVTRVV